MDNDVFRAKKAKKAFPFRLQAIESTAILCYAKSKSMLIKAYGEFWNPFSVDWKQKSLAGVGKVKGQNLTINFWEAKGIYVLLKEFKPVYIGKSLENRIGKRLFEHLDDRFAGRWDMFSWYSVSKPNKTTKDVNSPENRPVKLNAVITTFEALGILITDPPLNRKRESVPGAVEFEQNGIKPKTVIQHLEEIGVVVHRLEHHKEPAS